MSSIYAVNQQPQNIEMRTNEWTFTQEHDTQTSQKVSWARILIAYAKSLKYWRQSDHDSCIIFQNVIG